MKKLRVGVIGAGYLGKFHAEKYAELPDAELIGIADTDYSRAKSVAGRLGTAAYASHRDLLGKVDAVSIVVPTPHHFSVARDFLIKDVEVLIEKPMTVTLGEADELIRIAEDRGLIIQVGHLERFNPAVVALKGIVKKPMFIESHRLSPFKNRGTDVSVVLDLMIHDIDIIQNFVKSNISLIRAAGIPVITEKVDIANARIEFENGCVANVTASRVSIKNQRKIRLFQKDAYISVDFAGHDITIVRKNGLPLTESNGIIPGMDIETLRFEKSDALKDEINSFVHSVRDRTAAEVTGSMGREALRVALSIMDQIQNVNRKYFL